MTKDNLDQEVPIVSTINTRIYFISLFLPFEKKLLEMLTDNASAVAYIGLLTLRSLGAGLSFGEAVPRLNMDKDTLTV